MKYIVVKIEEDLDFGCEERAENQPVMAVVTLLDENGEESYLKMEDKLLYDRNINEGDTVVIDGKYKLQKEVYEYGRIFD